MTKGNLGRKFGFHISHQCLLREVKAGTWKEELGEATEELTGLPHGFFSLLSNTTHDYRWHSHHCLTPPKSIINQEYEQMTCLQVNVIEAISQLRS